MERMIALSVVLIIVAFAAAYAFNIWRNQKRG